MVGSVDEFEKGLLIVVEEAGVIALGVDSRLAPEHRFFTQIDEYAAVIAWAQGSKAVARGIKSDLVLGGGDWAGGNMTEALSLRLKDSGAQDIHAQLLLFPESRIPFDTPAGTENNSGLYLECNGIFSFVDHYLPRCNEALSRLCPLATITSVQLCRKSRI